MSKPIEKIEVRWSDVDANQHVRHSAYYDYGAHMRLRFFKSLGYSTREFQKYSIGPIAFHEQCHFIKELHLNETITINIMKGEVRDDGSRWEFYHEIFNEKGEKAAQINITGAWMDLMKRKLTVPPQDIAQAINALDSGEPFVYGKKPN